MEPTPAKKPAKKEASTQLVSQESSARLRRTPQLVSVSTAKKETLEDDEFIKAGDLIFLVSDEYNTYFFGESVRTRCIARPDDDTMEANFSSAIFRIAPKLEYSAQKELDTFKSEGEADPKAALKRLQEKADAEKKHNEEEERNLAGKQIFYGQAIQLVHFATNMFLVGDKHERADLEPSALKLLLDKNGSKNCWFRIMPRFKVRFEGEKIRRGDQIVLIHEKSGQFVHHDEKKYEDNGFFEVNLFNYQTGWDIFQFASFIPESERFVKGGDVVRIFHQEAEGFLKSNISPMWRNDRFELFLKVKSKKTIGDTTSSNTLFVIELFSGQGGVIPWGSEVRFKHLGTGKYLCLSRKQFTNDPNKFHVVLTRDLRNKDTVFVVVPVDKGDEVTSFGAYFRIGHRDHTTEDLKLRWLHVDGFIADNQTEESGAESSIVFSKNQLMEIVVVNKFHYQDVMSFKPVPALQVEELNFANSLYEVLVDFVRKLKGKETDESARLKRRQSSENVGFPLILETDTEPVIGVLKKAISFCNSSENPDPLLQNGIPNSEHQVLLFEQQFIEKTMEILYYLFGGTPQLWKSGESNAKMKSTFSMNLKSCPHIQETVTLVYKFFQILIKGNSKLGVFISTYLDLFLHHLGTVKTVDALLIELFSENEQLLNNIPFHFIDTFFELLVNTKKEKGARILEFIAALCSCHNAPVFKNQNYILDKIQEHPDILMVTRYDEAKDLVEIQVGPNDWVELQIFIKASPKEKVGVKDSQFEYNPKFRRLIDYYMVQVKLLNEVCLVNDRAINFLTKKIQSLTGQPLLSPSEVFITLKNDSLPGSIRAAYTDLFCQFIDADVAIKPADGIRFTWSWSELNREYKGRGTILSSQSTYQFEEEEKDGKEEVNDGNGEDMWLNKNGNAVKNFIIHFLDLSEDTSITDKENNLLLNSVLKLLEMMVKFNFVTSKEEQAKLMNVLIKFLNGKNDKLDGSKYRFSRFEKNEHTFLRLKAKLRVCKIVHLFYDFQLEEKTAANLASFRKWYEAGENTLEEGPSSSKKSKKKEKVEDYDELELMPTDDTKPFDSNSLVKILLDLTQYQDNSLTNSALSLLLRHMRPFDEQCNTLKNVQLLTNDKDVETFNDIRAQASILRDLLEDQDISKSETPKTMKILRNFVVLCTKNGDLNIPDIRVQTMFKNLGVHDVMFGILRLPYRPDYHPIFKMCYLFLKQFCLNNKLNQVLLFPHIDFMLRQMGLKLNIADTIAEILKDNHHLCSQMDTSFVSHIIKLIISGGRKRKYLALLSNIVLAEGHAIKKNQDAVVNQIMKKRDKILFLWDQVKLKHVQMGEKEEVFEQPEKKKSSKVRITESEEPKKPSSPETKKKIARVGSSINFLGVSANKKLDLEALEEQERNRVRNDDQEDLMYHIVLVDLLGRCCMGYNHLPEVMCQSTIPVSQCTKVLLDPEAGPMVKAAYCRFMAEVWFFTARPVSLYTDPKVWEAVTSFSTELQRYDHRREDLFYDNYVFEGMLHWLKTFFSHEFKPNELTQNVVKLGNDLLDSLCDLVKNLRDPTKIQKLSNCIEAISAAKIPGFNVTGGGEEIQTIVEKAKQKASTLSSGTVKAAQKHILEEKQKSFALKRYSTLMGERKVNSKTVLEIEYEDVVKVFKAPLLKKKKKNTQALAGSASMDLSSSSPAAGGKGAKFTEKLISQLNADASDTKLVTDCLQILASMIEIAEEQEDYEEFLATLKGLPREQQKLKKRSYIEDRRTEIQNILGKMGALQKAIGLLQSKDNQVIFYSLKLCCALFAGGNDFLQGIMMSFFLASSDPHFFDDIRNRIVYAVADLKNKRQSESINQKRNTISFTDPDELDDMENEEKEKGYLDLVLLFLQNLCEGHFLPLKNYLREQPDNTKSFNLVREAASFGLEIERSVESNVPLANQLFRSLTEFSSGCPQNQLSIMEAKIYIPFMNILRKFTVVDPKTTGALQLKVSMLELMLSLVEGQFPQKETETSSIPQSLLTFVDWATLDAAISSAHVHASVVIPEEDQKRMKENRPEGTDYVWKATTEEEQEISKSFVLNSLIFMKIVAEYAPPSHELTRILQKPDWINFTTENIATIEILNYDNELERVLFQIPDVCRNLKERSKEDLQANVKRDTPLDKVEDFVVRSEVLKFEMHYQAEISNSKLSFFANRTEWWRNVLLGLSILINGIMIGFYVDTDKSNGPGFEYDFVEPILYVLAALHVLFAALWVGVFFWAEAPIIAYKRKKERMESARQENLVRQKLGQPLTQVKTNIFHSIWWVLSDGEILYRLVYLLFSILGVAVSFPFFSFHLLDMSFRSVQVRNVLRAVTENKVPILLTALLGIIIVYCYSILGFFFLRTTYREEGLECGTLFRCIITTFNYGIRNGGGIGDALEPLYWEHPNYGWRLLFDITFFIIIIIILLNVVFGIILDTFGQLRDMRSAIEEDTKSRCFICGIKSDTFQRQALGFKHHVKHDHNMWAYLYFFVHLEQKDKDEYTHAEEYVSEKLAKGEIDYFPIGKAVCLQKEEGTSRTKKAKKPTKPTKPAGGEPKKG